MKVATARDRWRAFALVAPLLLFVLATFLAPLAGVFYNSLHDAVVRDGLPRTFATLDAWDGPRDQVPPEAVFAALAADMREAMADGSATTIANRLNIERSGLRTAFMRVARRVGDQTQGPWQPLFVQADAQWGELAPWGTLRNLGHRYGPLFYLAAVDLRQDERGQIAQQPEAQRLYVDVFVRTLGVSATVTGLCLVLGFAVAYLLAHLRERSANLLLILVLLPFWTSLLVRTSAWIVLLQKEGVVNTLLLSAGLIEQPLALIYNRFGVVVAMTHILLPFAILPMYSVMRQIPAAYVRAARSLGASPAVAFVRVYLPQCLPGVSAAVLLVFILALGYYITPTLVGGAGDQMMSAVIADNLSRSLNWGLAAALGVLLLAAVLMLYALHDRLVGVSNVRLS